MYMARNSDAKLCMDLDSQANNKETSALGACYRTQIWT